MEGQRRGVSGVTVLHLSPGILVVVIANQEADSLMERHRMQGYDCVRAIRQISLHATMSALAFQATAFVHILAGEMEDMRWMVRKVA